MLLATAYQKAYANFKRPVAEYGQTPIQVLVLEALRDGDGISAGEPGKRIVLDSTALSDVLDRLAEVRQKANDGIMGNLSAEESILLKRWLKDLNE